LPKVVLDTSVIVEYIDKEAKFQDQARGVFSAIIDGKIEAVVTYPTLSELYYVSARIYQKLGIEKPQSLAAGLVEWLFRLPSVTMAAENKELAVEAGIAKLKYCVALTDCYVLAASRVYGCKALFNIPEEEMLGKLAAIKKAYQLVFLLDYQ
jgi:uncharacterized protein